ncbi:ComEC/Rec2 family competence protein [Ferruginibacter profundus]
MKISFKDVGQGDSIVIEWKDAEGIEKIGIIDCKLKGKINPVLEYIKSSKYKEISFLILSHPHEDHYSGYLELLNYLEDSKIPIIRFGHTLGFNGVKSYWKYFEVNTRATDVITKIKKKWFALNKIGLIKQISVLIVNVTIPIDKHVSITCISPSHSDIEEYQKRVKLDDVKNEKEASRAANLLSTMLKLTFDGFNYLLTSDIENFAFNGALERESHYFKNVKFHLCQLAHHGSAKNYDPEFWKKIESFKIQNAIASAGNGYRHPSYKVLKAFHDEGYKVYSTNIVNGMRDFVKMLEKKSKKIDTFSTLAEEYLTSNDRIFEIQDGFVKLV